MLPGARDLLTDMAQRFGIEVTVARTTAPFWATLVWALVAGRTSVAEALRLIGEQMDLERRSRGPEWTTGCLGVVNQCIFRFRGPWGVETNDLNVENDVERFFSHSQNQEGRVPGSGPRRHAAPRPRVSVTPLIPSQPP